VTPRVSPASDDDTIGPGGRKYLNQSLGCLTDLAENQRCQPGQLAAQPGRQLPEAKRHGRGADVATDDDDRQLPRLHQPVSATAK
jgi:hypothetical protein